MDGIDRSLLEPGDIVMNYDDKTRHVLIFVDRNEDGEELFLDENCCVYREDGTAPTPEPRTYSDPIQQVWRIPDAPINFQDNDQDESANNEG